MDERSGLPQPPGFDTMAEARLFDQGVFYAIGVLAFVLGTRAPDASDIEEQARTAETYAQDIDAIIRHVFGRRAADDRAVPAIRLLKAACVAHDVRHQRYIALAEPLREVLRSRLKPGSEAGRDVYKMANDLLYALRGDPGGMNIEDVIAILDPVRPPAKGPAT